MVAANSLEVRVAAVADSLLDPADLAAASLDDRLRVRCAAVIVMAHAEIEEEIELACLAALDALESNPPIGFAFLAWGLSAVKANDPDAGDHAKQVKLGGTVKKLGKAYRDLIGKSHGISRPHLERMLLPLGVDTNALLLDIETLNSFGAMRGSAAHLSPLKAKIQKAPSTVRAEAITAAKAAGAVIDSIAVLANSLKAAIPPARRSRSLLWGLFRW